MKEYLKESELEGVESTRSEEALRRLRNNAFAIPQAERGRAFYKLEKRVQPVGERAGGLLRPREIILRV